MRSRVCAIVSLAIVLFASRQVALASPQIDALVRLKQSLEKQYSVQLNDWRFTRPDVVGAEQPTVDVSRWQAVSPGFSWSGENTKVWFRTRLVIPPTILGHSTEGLAIRLDLGVDDDGELYINGQLREAFHWDDCHYTLTSHAHVGDVYEIAVRGINTLGDGQLRVARLSFSLLPELDQFLTEDSFVGLLASRVPSGLQSSVKSALTNAELQINPSVVDSTNIPEIRREILAAHNALLPIATITRAQDVYYVGHAHIDMNWLWTWPETIDVCHRTWNSAMNIMDQVSDFSFVQSQPGAYAAIQAAFPEEFARMQQHQKGGQWDLVGGLWDESDTNMPSGEALARSLFIGQRFFKSHFGSYASTGWLPDSFGHSWQLPQLFQLTGIDSFYHMRCGNGMPFTWWESPDGSRVLKGNSDPYNASVELGQLLEPMSNARRFGVPETLVVFGVGDHGGGPTREMVLTAKAYQDDPILPKVHLVSADEFFRQLSARPESASYPIVNSDLQFFDEGCYTTHADMKKAVRTSENKLYSSEVLSSLASMTGANYPIKEFIEAWKPTAFAQFHDIMCGSAIHSTYDWMHQLLDPALQFEKDQTQSALEYLSKGVDTKGPSTQPIVVWNPLSFPRTDLVRVALPNASSIKSVVDESGHAYAAQASGDGTLSFVARQVPALGHSVYFPSHASCATDGMELSKTSTVYAVETSTYSAAIDRSTGAIAQMKLKSNDWSVFGANTDANSFQVLGDSGDAWTLQYTGEDHRLLGENCQVSVIEEGPVFLRIHVVHTLGKSSYSQDITAYGALTRLDVPTTIDWHEHGQTVKIRFPLNTGHPVARAQIPYGSIVRPTNGQECPGQKWMDVTGTTMSPVQNATPIDLASHFNSACTKAFDSDGRAYPSALVPSGGTQTLGSESISFKVALGETHHFDNIAALGQKITLPSGYLGDTLYVLAACANGGRSTWIGFRSVDGSMKAKAFNLNDWTVNNYFDNEVGLSFPYRTYGGNRDEGSSPKMWIVAIHLPTSRATDLVLPNDPQIHIFALTLGTSIPSAPNSGFSLLNDSKYGFDVNGSTFRLTALRSSNNPDPNPDEGRQEFTYSLLPHSKDWRAARTEEEALGLNIPLEAMIASNHAGTVSPPTISVVNLDAKGDVILGALKHSEDGQGYVLRIYEAAGEDTHVRIDFDRSINVEETDILERPIKRHPLTMNGKSVTLPVGHNQIVTLHITF